MRPLTTSTTILAKSLPEELGSTWSNLGATLVAAVGVFVLVIVLTRLTGPRALAKMSSFDFAATVAIGSVIASTALASTSLANGALALALLYGLQYLVATLRRRDALHGVVDNTPLLLMARGEVLDGNLQHARISREELRSQLRQAGVQRREQVHAVVLETTGDMSVLTGDGPFDSDLLAGVRGAEALRA